MEHSPCSLYSSQRRPQVWALTPQALRSFLSSASWFPCRLHLRGGGRFCSPFHRKENGQWLLPNPHPLLSPSHSHWAVRTLSHASTPITHMGLQSHRSLSTRRWVSVYSRQGQRDSESQGKAGGKLQLGGGGWSSCVEVVWSVLNTWPNLAASHLGYQHRTVFAVREHAIQLGRREKTRVSWNYSLPDPLL